MTTGNKLKRILGNGLPFGAVFAGLSMLLGYLFRLSTNDTIIISILIGVVALLANGLIYSRFSRSEKKLNNITVALSNSEVLVLECPANHRIEERLVPGKLFLTKERILFKSYSEHEAGALEYSWPLLQLKAIGFYKSIRNSGGEFLLETADGVSLMFEVDKIKPWKEFFRSR